MVEEIHDVVLGEMKNAQAKHTNSMRLQKRSFTAWRSICQGKNEQKLNYECTLDRLLTLPGAPAPCAWMGEVRPRRPLYQVFRQEIDDLEPKRPRLSDATASRVSLYIHMIVVTCLPLFWFSSCFIWTLGLSVILLRIIFLNQFSNSLYV